MLGEKIKSLRLDKDITLKSIAEAVNKSSHTVINWESCKTEPNITELKIIAEKLGTTVSELISEHESNESKLIAKFKYAIKEFDEDEISSLIMVMEGFFLRHQSHAVKKEFEFY